MPGELATRVLAIGGDDRLAWPFIIIGVEPRHQPCEDGHLDEENHGMEKWLHDEAQR